MKLYSFAFTKPVSGGFLRPLGAQMAAHAVREHGTVIVVSLHVLPRPPLPAHSRVPGPQFLVVLYTNPVFSRVGNGFIFGDIK
jgi:hypothetical protein